MKTKSSFPRLFRPANLVACVLLASGPSMFAALGPIPSDLKPAVIVSTEAEPVATGKFQPTWESLSQYEVPEWARDAKFGIWAHWGPQCQPETGDWYARQMYVQGHGQNRFHVGKYGHPSEFGFKDVIHAWKADKWEPEKLVALYKRVGAQYFFAMANHHDNFDMWDSKYQPWNSVAIGPKQNIIGRWAKAARAQGLPFGISVHASHAWSWYETAQGADRDGDKAGVPYDGKLTKADGKGKWWDGLDPQDLYAQNHTPAPNFGNAHAIHARWHWNGVTQPDQAYCEKFYNRTMDLINKYQPDLLYFDDTALPTVWDESVVLSAEIDKHVVIARRSGDRWYVAAMNGDDAVTLDVSLDFLGSKRRDWRLREFADGDDSAAPETVVETTRELGKTRSLSLRLQSGGGYAAVISPAIRAADHR